MKRQPDGMKSIALRPWRETGGRRREKWKIQLPGLPRHLSLSTIHQISVATLLSLTPSLGFATDPSAHDPQPAPGSPGATRAAVMQVFGDPDFRKRAIENFNLHSDLEPKLPATEKEAFTKIADLAATDVVKAYFELKAKVTADSSAVFDFTLGSIAYQLNRPNEAAKYLESATRKFPSYLRAYKNLGLIQLQQGRTI